MTKNAALAEFIRVKESNKEMLAALKMALQYLEHPDVRTIPFALHVDATSQRIRAILAAEGERPYHER